MLDNLTKPELKELWTSVKRLSFADKIKKHLPNDLFKDYFEGALGIVNFNYKDNFVTTNNVNIPLTTMVEIDKAIETGDTIFKMVHALEKEGYEAHKFFKFPEFKIDSGTIMLNSGDLKFYLDKAHGSHIPLFKMDEVKEIIRMINNA